MKVTKKTDNNLTIFNELKIGTWFIFNAGPLYKVSNNQYFSAGDNRIHYINHLDAYCKILEDYRVNSPLIPVCDLKNGDMFTYYGGIWIKVNDDTCVCLSNTLPATIATIATSLVTKISPDDLEIIY